MRVVHHYGARPEFVVLGGLVPGRMYLLNTTDGKIRRWWEFGILTGFCKDAGRLYILGNITHTPAPWNHGGRDHSFLKCPNHGQLSILGPLLAALNANGS